MVLFCTYGMYNIVVANVMAFAFSKYLELVFSFTVPYREASRSAMR